ncbi:MAG: hypothetical protein ACR2IK_14575 [Chloroflexota bacterium]
MASSWAFGPYEWGRRVGANSPAGAHATIDPLSPDPRRLWPRTQRRLRLSPAWLVAAASLVFSLGAIIWLAALQGQIVALQTDAQVTRERAARYDHVAEV